MRAGGPRGRSQWFIFKKSEMALGDGVSGPFFKKSDTEQVSDFLLQSLRPGNVSMIFLLTSYEHSSNMFIANS